MLKTILILTFFQAGIVQYSISQDSVSLDYCLGKAAHNHPRSGDTALIENISYNKIHNIKAGNLPILELNGKASYQSDVISLDIPFPGIDLPASPKDQYKVSLDVTQSIYDGGYAKSKQKIEGISEQVEKSQLEIDIRISKMHVKDLFYNLLLIQQNKAIIDISITQLLENRDVIETGILSGVLLNSDLDLLDVEIIKLKQRKSELENSRLAGVQVLANRIGEDISFSAVFIPTDYSSPSNDSIQRIEKHLFDLQYEQIGRSIALVKSRTLPKLFVFGQFGYGNPGLNMLKDEFDTYYIVGAGLKWAIWDWNTSNRDKEVIGLQQNIIESRKKQFESEVNSALLNQKSVIRNHEENLLAFANILILRSRITANSKIQLEHGVIRTIDFISVIDQETIARIQFETEKTLLQQSIARYLEIKGEL